MEIKLKKLRASANIPTRGTEDAAGYDLYANTDEDVCPIPAHTAVKIGTGIAISIPHGYFGAIFARSGLATRRGLRPANCVGVIDSDYRGEIIVALHNDTDVMQYVHNGDRIAQLIIQPYQAADFLVVDDLDGTDRGTGGFGSTGLHDAIDPECVKQPLFTGEFSFSDETPSLIHTTYTTIQSK